MTHEEVLEALGAYADGELDASDHAAVESHLATCAACRGELEALRELDGALGTRPVPDPGAQYWAHFADRVVARTGGAPSPGGARFYERLTGWLFPNERFAWVRAATALAACTLLVTIGLHGFRSMTLRVGAPTEPGMSSSETPPARELNLPPAGPAGDSSDRAAEARRYGSSESGEAVPPAEEPERSLVAARPEPVPPAATHDRGPSAAKSEAPSEAGKPVPAPVHEYTAVGESSPRSFQGEAQSKRQAAIPPAARPDASSTPPGISGFAVAPPAATGAADTLVGSMLQTRTMKPRPDASMPMHIGDESTSGSSDAPVESLLARDARLWPRRDEPEARAQLEALANDLVRRATDPRVRPRARAYLEYLAATSGSDADRERWERTLRSLQEP